MNPDTLTLLDDINTSIIRIRAAYATWAAQNNIGYYELLVFYSLFYGKSSQKQMCTDYRIPKQSLSHVIRGLEAQGYLTFLPSSLDRREKLLALTEKGKTFSDELLKPLLKLEEISILEMGEDSIRQMTSLAARYGTILDELFTGETPS